MQLSNITASLLLLSCVAQSESYIAVEYLQYDESNDRVTVQAPTVSASIDIGTDYTILASYVHDAVSGATPTFKKQLRRITVNNRDFEENEKEFDEVDSKSGSSARTTSTPTSTPTSIPSSTPSQRIINSNQIVNGLQSFTETRDAESLLVTKRFSNRDELTIGGDYSEESDYIAYTGSFEYMHFTDTSHNTSFTIGSSYSYNEILNFDSVTGASGNLETSQSITVQAGITQVINRTSSFKIAGFFIGDKGFLTNPHSLIVRSRKFDNENRPDTRDMYGMSLKYIKLFQDSISMELGYRLYNDNWSILSHTFTNNLYYEVNDNLTLGASLRFYAQSEAFFYSADRFFFTNQTFASSDQRLSRFNALTYHTSIDFKQNEHISYNLGANFYTQTTNLDALYFTAGIKYRF